MKFQDIPQFPTSRYEIDVSWNYIEMNLEQLKGEGELRLDPDYQRGHVWTQEQQQAYVEYVLRGGEVSRTIIFNAPNWDDGKDTFIELVDGKQRLEAVRAFMRNDIPAFGTYFKDFEDKFPTMNIRFRFQVCCLKTRAEVLDLYLKINAGGTPHSETELERVRKMLKKEAQKAE